MNRTRKKMPLVVPCGRDLREQKMNRTNKSSYHSKIAGDFGESLMLYWLSRHGYECVLADHTGIDIIARKRHGNAKPWGIAVQTRTRRERKKRRDSVNFGKARWDKAKKACNDFRCVPYVAFVVDAPRGTPGRRNKKANKQAVQDPPSSVRVYLTSMEYLKKMRMVSGWLMSDKRVKQYEKDPHITRLTLHVAEASGW